MQRKGAQMAYSDLDWNSKHENWCGESKLGPELGILKKTLSLIQNI